MLTARSRKQVLIALICTQTLTVLVITCQTSYFAAEFEKPQLVAIGRHTKSTEDDDQSQQESKVTSDNRINSVTAEAVVDLLLAADDGDERSDKLSMRKGSLTLVDLVVGLGDPSGKDDLAADENNTSKTSGTSDARRRLERLARLVDSAKYELEEMSRRRKMEPAVAALVQIVENMKRTQAAPGNRRTQLSTLRLNLYDNILNE